MQSLIHLHDNVQTAWTDKNNRYEAEYSKCSAEPTFFLQELWFLQKLTCETEVLKLRWLSFFCHVTIIVMMMNGDSLHTDSFQKCFSFSNPISWINITCGTQMASVCTSAGV